MSKEILDDIDHDSLKDDTILEEEMEGYLRSYIQKNADSYIKFWKSDQLISFDVLKMFLGVPWMMYRKLYIYALLMTFIFMSLSFTINKFAIIPLYSIIFIIVNFNEMSTYQLLMNIGATLIIMIPCGLLNRALYMFHSERVVKTMKRKFGHEKFLNQLKLKGGTEGVLSSIVLVGLLMLLVSTLGDGLNPVLIF